MALLPRTQLPLLANKSSTCPELTSVVLQEVAREESNIMLSNPTTTTVSMIRMPINVKKKSVRHKNDDKTTTLWYKKKLSRK